MAKHALLKRPVLAWALYDWANSAFAVVIISGFFPIYYNALSQQLSAADSQFWFNITLAVSSFAVAVAAPLLGAIADRVGKRKKFLIGFALLGILMSGALAWVQAGMWWLALLLYGLGSIGFSAANIFYDSMLMEVGEPDELDLISAYGFSLGYLGGGLLFAFDVLLVTQYAWFGFASAGAALKVAFVSVALWWAIFSLPLLRSRSDSRSVQSATPTTQAIRQGLAQLVRTVREVRRHKTLLGILLAYWFYIDGVGTVIKMAVFFGERVIQLPRDGLIVALLLTQFVAFPAALAFGKLAGRIGAKRSILIALSVYAVAIIYAWRWLNSAQDFYMLAMAIGLVQGGVQSLSRSLYARFVSLPRRAEFFGLFNMVGKFAAILGPLLIAFTPNVLPFADARDSILSLLLLFGIGGWLLARVDVDSAGGK